MEVKLITKPNEQTKFNEIDELLPNLWKEGLLTEIECRIIVSSTNIVEKRGAVYKVIISKTKEEAAILTKAFEKLALGIDGTANPISLFIATNIEENNYSVLPETNLFLNNTIIKHLFGFLPLEDMKLSRLVCRHWNSTAEICLRKRSAIHFWPNVLLPTTFCEISKYSQPDLPFPSFAFCNDEDTSWKISDIQNFLKKWEKNIKEVAFKDFSLISGDERLIRNYNVTQLFFTPSNITSLKISYPEYFRPKTKLNISLEKFVSIRAISLSECRVIVPVEIQSTCIAPLIISFDGVWFLQNGKIITDFNYKCLFDFSKALNINLEHNFGAILDMTNIALNVDRLRLAGITLENWTQAKGDVERLRLYSSPFVGKNNLKIEMLNFAFSKIDLAALPQTLQVLELGRGDVEIICSEPIHLPILKYLYINAEDNDSLAYFVNCPNLVELVLRTIKSFSPTPWTFNLTCVPKTVKKMTMVFNRITFVDNCIFELNTLILVDMHDLLGEIDNTIITAQIKAKELVFVCGIGIEVDASDIVKLVLANQQSQRIVIGIHSNLYTKTPFEGSDFSKYVDKESNFYQFDNIVGKSITQTEFEKYYNMNDHLGPDI